MVNYLSDLLSNRTSYVKCRNAESTYRQFNRGVPQGSPLSPLLFTIYTAKLLENVKGGKAAFADDLAI